MMDKVVFILRSKHWSQVVEAISLGNVVSQACWIWMSMILLELDIKVVGEHFLGVGCDKKTQKNQGKD